eukprot:TRINITY_DN6107_c0_g1_i1.p1 TRINITY_DN6107_c0_g1~~TRINITY_DN6107_c0_g1_i1.p1  ORF type:complete len:978 (-),score=289.68 TRINITY_DN6107_c0_g1_i1:173-2851(-)
MSVTSYPDNVYRLQINEAAPLSARYEVQGVLLDSVVPSASQNWKTEGESNVLTGISSSAITHSDSLRVDFANSQGENVVSFNERNLFYFEHLRPKPEGTGSGEDSAEASDSLPGEAASVDPNDFWAAKEGGEAGSEEEDSEGEEKQLVAGIDFSKAWGDSFNGFEDPMSHGPQSIGLDISFPFAKKVYGIPEHATDLALKETDSDEDGKYSDPYRLYNLDVFEYELDQSMALYGHVPFMLAHSKNSTTGVFYMNASEMWIDVKYRNSASGGILSSFFKGEDAPGVDTRWMVESGVVDIFVVMGPTPKDVLRQFTSLVGRQALPPLFSLGYHQCRWNYNSQEDALEVNAKFDELDMPYSVLWLDIEHTDGKRYFTWNYDAFPTPTEMINEVAKGGRKMVNIVDPHLKVEDGYYVFDQFKEKNLLVNDATGSAAFEGNCWAGNSAWVDYLMPEAQELWADQFLLSNYAASTEDLFVWNDMNEPAVFQGPEKTMPKSLMHLGNTFEHRDVHNLYGMFNQKSTTLGLVKRAQGKVLRPFVLSRAFYAGTQRYGAIWTGDNTATWGHMAQANPMLLSMGLAGIQFCGSDVGGFFENPDPELVVRWSQGAAYHPFFRGHAHIDAARKEPWVWGEPWTSLNRAALISRYQILPYLYTLFHEATITGAPPMRPLWFEFPEEEETFTVQETFLLGESLLVTPVAAEGQLSTNVYFPGGESTLWYDTVSFELQTGGGVVAIASPIEKIPVFQKGGSIVSKKMRPRRSQTQMEFDPYTLIVAADKDLQAEGTLYIDDGETFEFETEKSYLYRKFSLKKSSAEGAPLSLTFSSSSISESVYEAGNVVEKVIILGVEGIKNCSLTAADGSSTDLNCFYEENTEALVIRNPRFPIESDFLVSLASE